MGLRVRRSIKLLPGVRINLSKSGISTSIGARGASVNLKPGRKAKVTVGIPGTGLSYSTKLGNDSPSEADDQAMVSGRRIMQLIGAFFFVLSAVCTAEKPSEPWCWFFLILGGVLAYKFRPPRA